MTGWRTAGEKRPASAPVANGHAAAPICPKDAQNPIEVACRRRGMTFVRTEMATCEMGSQRDALVGREASYRVDWTDEHSDDRNDDSIPDERVGEPDSKLESPCDGRVEVQDALLAHADVDRVEQHAAQH